MPDDPLMLDISKDLERVDEVMTKIVMDNEEWERFKSNPNATLARLGLHPQTSEDVNQRVNRVFFATITNQELNRLVAEHFLSFSPPDADKFAAYHSEGLSKGVIQNDIRLDRAAAEHVFKDPEFMRKLFKLLLTDLNEKRILQKHYSERVLDEFLDRLIVAIVQRRPIAEHPRLEQWDENYGVGGFHFGTEAAEVGPAVTAYVAVEMGAFVTVFGAHVQTPDRADLGAMVAAGDEGAAIRVRTMGRILHCGADLVVHAQQMERRTK